MAAPFMVGASIMTTLVTALLGAALVLLSIHRGPIRERYGLWSRLI